MGSRTALRRTALALAATAALGGAFALGVVAGVGSQPEPGVLDDAAQQIAGSSLHPVERGDLDAAAIRAMLGQAGDQWGSWGEGTTGAYAGVGLALRTAGASLLVSQVSTGSPAALAGIEVGDELRTVDGRAMIGVPAADAAAGLRGRTGTLVQVVVARGRLVRTLLLTRATVPAARVVSTVLEHHVGQIVVPVFTRGTGRQVRDAVRDLHARGVTGLVLDLRGDPGGLLAEAVETASAFLDGGQVVTYTRRDEEPQHLEAVGDGETRTPLVVLVDGGTASAAEVVAGALQDRGRAVVVGSRTFGKGSVQEPHRLSDGSSLALTVATYSLPSGRSVEGVGIEPDIEVDGDGAVQRAVEVLSGLLADTGGRG